jgi:uncharacterized membrane protein YccC
MATTAATPTRALGWRARLRARDPGNVAFRRGVRVALVTPLVFAFLLEVADSPEAAIFGAFGGFAFLGFADFGGRPWPRARAYLVLTVLGAGLVVLGTVLSTHPWAAAAVMLPVGVAIRFTGFFGGPFAAAVSPAILAYVLAATVPGAGNDIPDRLAGWVLAGVVATLAALIVLPRREHHLVTQAAARACDALADAFDARRTGTAERGSREHADRAVLELRRVSGMFRRCGPSAHDLALTFTIDELRLLTVLADRPDPFIESGQSGRVDDHVSAQLRAAGRALDGTEPLDANTIAVARVVVWDETTAAFAEAVSNRDDPRAALATLDAVYVERVLLYLVTSLQGNVAVLLTGRAPERDAAGLAPLEVPAVTAGATFRRIASLVRTQAVPTSSWLRDSLRAGVALAVAVLVAGLASVDHGFWVVLGTLAVLRSNAFETGRSALDAAVGTSVGFGVSSAFFAVVGLDEPALWVVTIAGFFLAAWLPQVAGFIAGQAAFTVMVVALFNLVEPTGWTTGLVRVQDIVIGASVSLIVALVFWPRRAVDLLRSCTAGLYRALGDAAAAPTPAFDEVRTSERRAHAAFTQFLDEQQSPRPVDAPWATLLSVAGLGRTGLRFVEVHRDALRDASVRSRLEAAYADVGATWHMIGDALAARARPDREPPRAASVADATRPIAIDAIARAERDGVTVAMQAALFRDWLVELSSLLEIACDAAAEVATTASDAESRAG